jgi:hypothetical protein
MRIIFKNKDEYEGEGRGRRGNRWCREEKKRRRKKMEQVKKGNWGKRGGGRREQMGREVPRYHCGGYETIMHQPNL